MIHLIKMEICDLFVDDTSAHNPDYIQLYNLLKSWLSNTNISNMNEKDLQLHFYNTQTDRRITSEP